MFSKGYSTYDMEKLGVVSHSNMASYIAEDMCPSAWTLAKLCVVLNVSADYLLFGKEL